MLLTRKAMGPGRFALYAVVGVTSAFLVLPILFIVALSFGSSPWLAFPPPEWTLRWYGELFGSPEWMASMLTSLQVAITVTVLSLALGVPAAFALVRGRFPGRETLQAFFTTPLMVPLVIIGIALYALFLEIGLTGTFVAFVASHLVLALPFSVIAVSNSLRTFDTAIEKAAVICGASPWQALGRVTFPAIKEGIIAGGMFSFLISWDEVVLGIFMASPTLQTLPVKMWGALRLDLTPTIAAAATVLVALTVTLMVILGLTFERRKTAR